MAGLWAVQDDELQVRFHEGQQEAYDAIQRIVAVISGTQGGKTSFGPWWMYSEIYGDDTIGRVGRGGGDYLAVTSTYDLFKLKMLPEMLEVFEGITHCAKWWAGDQVLELRNPVTGQFEAKRSTDPMWGRIILRSASSPGGLESATAKAAWLDEAGQDLFRIDAWDAVLRRLSIYRGRVLITTTPYNFGWLKTEVYDRAAHGDKNYRVVNFPSSMNPAFPREEVEDRRTTMQAWKFRMFYLGLFERPPGVIYEGFKEEKHTVDPFRLPAAWPRYLGLDFGPVHNAGMWLAYDAHDDMYYVYREQVWGGQTTVQNAKHVLELSDGERLLDIRGGGPSETQERMDWADAGVMVLAPSVGSVEPQIDRVHQLFQTDRLQVFTNCRGTIDDLLTYRRELDRNDEVTDRIHNKSSWHRLDALRYIGAEIATLEPGSVYEPPVEMANMWAVQ